MLKQFLLSIFIISGFLYFVPEGPVDTWGLINPNKILKLILFLFVVQMLSSILISRGLSRRIGGIALGFLSGLISSTAYTATLVRESHDIEEDEARLLSLSYLSALLGTGAEAFVLVVLGHNRISLDIVYIFIFPILVNVALVFWRSRRIRNVVFSNKNIHQPSVVAMLRLGLFITAVLILAKALQIYFGDYGVVILTFIASLFELQGAVIANLQLYESSALSRGMLGNVLAIGLFASYISKLLIVMALGGAAFKIRVLRYTFIIILALGLGWAMFMLNLSLKA